MKTNLESRRSFIGKTATTAGLAAIGVAGMSNEVQAKNAENNKLPREVWIATVSQNGLSSDNPPQMTEKILAILKRSLAYQPDIVCLPEVFATSNVKPIKTLVDKVELSAIALKQFSAFAKENRCYLICPVYTSQNGKIFNSAVLFDRMGETMGEYHKIHLTEDEIEDGMSPGSLDPPIFKTDFGIIGIQICFDILWDDGWKALKQKGAEIVFWPSAYAGGEVLNGKAWMNKYIVVSSTRKNTAKICEFTGEVIAQTGIWDPNLICAPVNLEKAFLHAWPFCQRFEEIRAKYGRKIRITNHHEEEWSVIESLSHDLLIKDILKEYNLKTFDQHVHDSELAQNKARK